MSTPSARNAGRPVKVGSIVQHMYGDVGEVLQVFKSGGKDWLTVRWFNKRKTKGECMLKSIEKVIPPEETL